MPTHYGLPSAEEIRALERLYRDDPLWIITSSGNKRRRHQPTARAKRTVRFEVFHRDHFTCQLCEIQYSTPPPEWDGTETITGPRGHLALDHIVPYSKGGLFTVENLRAACEKCNMSRGNRD